MHLVLYLTKFSSSACLKVNTPQSSWLPKCLAEVAESAAVEEIADAFSRWPPPLSHDLVYAGAFESYDMEERRRCREYLRNPSLFIGGTVVGAATQEELDAASWVRFNRSDAEKFANAPIRYW